MSNLDLASRNFLQPVHQLNFVTNLNYNIYNSTATAISNSTPFTGIDDLTTEIGNYSDGFIQTMSIDLLRERNTCV